MPPPAGIVVSEALAISDDLARIVKVCEVEDMCSTSQLKVFLWKTASSADNRPLAFGRQAVTVSV